MVNVSQQIVLLSYANKDDPLNKIMFKAFSPMFLSGWKVFCSKYPMRFLLLPKKIFEYFTYVLMVTRMNSLRSSLRNVDGEMGDFHTAKLLVVKCKSL